MPIASAAFVSEPTTANRLTVNGISGKGWPIPHQEATGGATPPPSQGCDGSILLEDTANFTGEQHARPNNNSVRGFGVVAKVKAAVEKVCPGVVSCDDVMAVVARDSVVILGGASWKVKLGRRDATTASLSAANSDFPPPTSNLSSLISKFSAKGLTVEDMMALSAHFCAQT